MPDRSLIKTILESILKEAMGLNISSIGASSLKHAVTRRMRGLEMDNPHHYFNLIKNSIHELNELIEEVTVNETWFFRDEVPFTALRDYAVTFHKNNQDLPLRLLSIPCSTGEEPYSMAITLIEAGLPPHSFVIDAVDINRRSLAIAQQCLYRGHSFRGQNALRHQAYFTKTREGYTLDQTIKDQVRFHRGNLIHLDRSLTDSTYQVIFCRNLLIYLDASFHQQAINTFDSLLADNGLLFIGHAEAGIFSASRFCPTNRPKAFAFHKRPPAHPPARGDQTESPLVEEHYPTINPTEVQGAEPLQGREWPTPEGLDQPIRHYEEMILKNGPSAEAFYQLATLFEQKKDWKNAIKMLKKATYLDPNSIESIDMLAAIYQLLGEETNYQTCLNRAQRIKNRLSPPPSKQ